MRTYLGLAVAVLLGLAPFAQATPVDLKQIPADAKWAAHLDVDVLMASKSMQKIRDQIRKEHPEAESGLALIRTMWRFDPTTDLHGVTVYGTQLKKNTGVAIIRAKVDQKFLLDMVKLAPDHKTTAYGKYELHTWLKDGTKRENATFYQPDVIVFASSFDELKAALDVLDGTRPNFASTSHISAESIPAGTILAAAARDLASAQLPLESPVARQAESFALIVGENQGQIFVRSSLAMKQADLAKQIKTVVDGALALASLAKMDDADALKLIGAVKVMQNDKVVSLEAQAPVDEVWTQIQKEHAKKHGEMTKHFRHMHHNG